MKPLRLRYAKTCIAAALLGMLTAAGCNQPRERADEDVAESQEAVQNGTIDSTETYSDVVQVFGIGRCSGILISPLWVLTSRHCFIDSHGNDLTWQDVQVTAGFDPAHPTMTRYHTWAIGGEVAVVDKVPYDVSDNAEVAKDLALVRLYWRMPYKYAHPRHIPTTVGACGDTFDGTIVGYGGAYDGCADPVQEWFRRSRPLTTVNRAHEAQGFDIFDGYFGAGDACHSYTGLTYGDFGGPLLKSDGTLCGVASGKASFPGLAPYIPPYVIGHGEA
jgi:hypothetical protein